MSSVRFSLSKDVAIPKTEKTPLKAKKSKTDNLRCLKNGRIRYSAHRITKSTINQCQLIPHDKVIKLLENWNGGGCHSHKHLLIPSNYIWIYRSKNEINSSMDVEEEKLLPIVSLRKINRGSLSQFRFIVLHDKYAHIFELLKKYGFVIKYKSTLIKEVNIKKERVDRPKHEYTKVIVNGPSFDCKRTTMYCVDNRELNALYLCIVKSIPDFNLSNVLFNIYKNNQTYIVSLYKKLLKIFETTHQEVCNILNNINSAQKIREICEIVMKNEKKLITEIQGKESSIRNAVTKKVHSFRAQISLCPYMMSDEIIVPAVWSQYFNISPSQLSTDFKINLYDSDQVYKRVPKEYQYEISSRILLKRDPIIKAYSASVAKNVIFHEDSRLKIGPDSLTMKGADFDGDTHTFYILDNPDSIVEMDLQLSPEYQLFQNADSRIKFTESFVMLMYKRDVKGKLNHHEIYDYIRDRLTYKYLQLPSNRLALQKIADYECASANRPEFSLTKLYQMAEPTGDILDKYLYAVDKLFGPMQAVYCYKTIVHLCMELEMLGPQAKLYQSNLPCDYTLTDNLICRAFLVAGLSLAKGDIFNVLTMIERQFELDRTTQIRNTISTNIDYEKIIRSITESNQESAKKSKQVRCKGHTVFKESIGCDTISFENNSLRYEGHILLNNMEILIPSLMLMETSLAFYMIRDGFLPADAES